MTGDYAMYDRQAHARAVAFFRIMQALEDTEQLSRVLHGETHPVVLDAIYSFTVVNFASHENLRVRAGAAVFERVAEQVDPHLAKKRAVSLRRGQRPHIEPHPICVLVTQHFLRDGLGESSHVDACCFVNYLSAEFRESKKIVDQSSHLDGLLADYSEQPLSFIIEAIAVVFFHHPGIAIDRAQRGAQIVRYRI